MTSYVVRAHGGWFVLLANDANAIVDIAGPFDDEEDCEMARIRIEEVVS